jgi:membrane associated rhomboid family serine protease
LRKNITQNNPWLGDLIWASIFPLTTILLYAYGQWQDVSFSFLGLRPRHIDGLLGILTSPLAHGSWDHVWSNAIPLWVLSFYILQNYRSVFFQVLFYGILIGGLCTWISARDARHIGASGEVYAMFGFLFLSGILNRSKRTLGTTLLVVFMYGGLIWGIFPEKQEISYEGHLWGLVAGLTLAWYYKDRFRVKRFKIIESLKNRAFLDKAEQRFGKYYWDKEKHDAWLQEQEEMKRQEENNRNTSQGFSFYYTIKKDPDDSSRPS